MVQSWGCGLQPPPECSRVLHLSVAHSLLEHSNFPLSVISPALKGLACANLFITLAHMKSLESQDLKLDDIYRGVSKQRTSPNPPQHHFMT